MKSSATFGRHLSQLEKKQPKMPPPTALGRILVVHRFACPTNWWASGLFGQLLDQAVGSVKLLIRTIRKLRLVEFCSASVPGRAKWPRSWSIRTGRIRTHGLASNAIVISLLGRTHTRLYSRLSDKPPLARRLVSASEWWRWEPQNYVSR